MKKSQASSLRRRAAALVAAAAVAVGILIVLAPTASAMTAKANHDDIKIGLTYNGSTVSVSGITDPGADLILKITSADSGSEKLMRKDKEAGMWMNVEEVTFNNAPEVYFLRSTGDPASILDAGERDRYVIGYPALKNSIELKPAKTPGETAALLDEFINYKESGKLYGVSQGDVDIKPDADGESYYTLFQWPYQAPPGNYQVDVYAVKDGRVVDTAQSQVLVEQDGAIKALSDLAQNNGAVYGIAAIGVSVTAGFGVGIVFKGGGGSH